MSVIFERDEHGEIIGIIVSGGVGGTLNKIGQGGSGTDESIPKCEICGAYGGGGHGGGCPNIKSESK